MTGMADLPEKNNQEPPTDLDAVVQFDAGDFDKRLAETNKAFQDELAKSRVYTESSQEKVTLNFTIPEARTVTAQATTKTTVEENQVLPQSSFLASLAMEAKQSQQDRNSLDDEKHTSNQSVHEALDRVLKFFVPFIQHVNAMAPAINRTYRLDARSIFANLKWQGALVDSRKQGMNDESLISYVAFSVNLMAPEPVLFKRPWGQFDALKKELQLLKIRPLDDLDQLHKKPKQEWLETHLDPALPVQISFQGNYELGKIDVLTRNLADFGQNTFRLEPANISAYVLDELGLFLIGRTDKLPGLLRPANR
jgi:hypothetical protein